MACLDQSGAGLQAASVHAIHNKDGSRALLNINFLSKTLFFSFSALQSSKMGKNKSTYKTKKRKFQGNQYASSVSDPKTPENPADVDQNGKRKSSSASKLGSRKRLRLEKEACLEGNRIMDIGLISEFIGSVSCPNCLEKSLSLSECLPRYGLASKFEITCYNEDCEYYYILYSSGKATDGKKKFFSINRLLPMATMSSGNHYTSARRLVTGLNLPPPQSLSSWQGHMAEIKKATKTVATVNMKRAAAEVRGDETVADVVVSCDGTWQKRGFASKNGVGTVLTVDGPGGSSKVVDTCTLSNYCVKCQTNTEHAEQGTCPKNHDGSAGSMEPAAMMTIFKRSVKTRGLRYTGYLGDGDSKSYSQIRDADPPIYTGSKSVKKLECCGHVQKRMGKRLSDKVAEHKNKSWEEDGKKYKGIGGVGRLTQKAIKSIQGHYGAAIRSNVGNVPGMKKAIWAIFKHRNKNHSDCGSWCPAVKGVGDPDKHAFPKYVCQAIKPVFEILSETSLLEKCAHGGSQNPNESFHNLIWSKCPKSTFVGRFRLEIAVAEATIVYNSGELARKDVYTLLKVPMTSFLTNEMKLMDSKRIQNAYMPGDRSIMAKRRAKSVTSAAQKSDETYGAGKF